MNPFDYVNSILDNKKNLIVDDVTEKEYNPFLSNKSLSYHKDCVLFANEMNRRHHLEKKMQYDFLMSTVRNRKRKFSKWVKKEDNDNLEYIKRYFNCSSIRAEEYIKILSESDIKLIKEKTDFGGLKNTK